VGQLIGGQFLGELSNGVGGEGHQAAARHLARVRADVILAETRTGRAEQVVLRLQVFEVEREVEDGVVIDLGSYRRALGHYGPAPAAAGGQCRPGAEGRHPIEGAATIDQQSIAFHGGSSVVLSS
jgi:hypothetical protein